MSRPKLLSGPQRSTLAALAREAYAHLQQGLSETFDEFRHLEARSATKALPGAPAAGWKISEAPASAFDALFDHFKTLKGQGDVAFDRQMQGISSEMRNLLHLITVAELAAGVTSAYTAAICRNMKFGGDAPKNPKQAKAILIALQTKARNDAARRAGEEVPV